MMALTNKLILIVVETNHIAQTDAFYISRALSFIYKIDNDIKISYIYLSSKSKYNDKGHLLKIKKEVKNYNNYHIIYCLDTDDITTDSYHKQINNDITNFCLNHHFELVWFCRDIEEVFLHKHIEDNQKVREAKKFGSKNNLGLATIDSLSSEQLIRYKSNLMNVFDQYLKRH